MLHLNARMESTSCPMKSRLYREMAKRGVTFSVVARSNKSVEVWPDVLKLLVAAQGGNTIGAESHVRNGEGFVTSWVARDTMGQ
jgi:hypothetical protein